MYLIFSTSNSSQDSQAKLMKHKSLIIFFFIRPKHVVGAKKSCPTEMVLLSTPIIFFAEDKRNNSDLLYMTLLKVDL